MAKAWRAWDTFLACLAAAFVLFLAFMATALYYKVRYGAVTTAQFTVLLGWLRYGTYPIVFVGLGALLVHYVKFYRGDYARR